MTNPSHRNLPPEETPLQEGLRRYAPKNAEARRVAVGDFLLALLLMNHRPGSGSEL